MSNVVKIADQLWSVAARRAKASKDGVGRARTKNQSVTYELDPYGIGMSKIESVRFINSPTIETEKEDE